MVIVVVFVAVIDIHRNKGTTNSKLNCADSQKEYELVPPGTGAGARQGKQTQLQTGLCSADLSLQLRAAPLRDCTQGRPLAWDPETKSELVARMGDWRGLKLTLQLSKKHIFFGQETQNGQKVCG